jgi:hypothetical protein
LIRTIMVINDGEPVAGEVAAFIAQAGAAVGITNAAVANGLIRETSLHGPSAGR